MKKQYTKKQITEAIAYWQKQLRMMNEEGPTTGNNSTSYIEALRDACRNSSLPTAEFGVDELIGCQPPISETEFREMYKNDLSMQKKSDDRDTPYDVAMKMFRGGCKFVGFINNIHSDLPSLLLGDECPDFAVAEMLTFGRDEMMFVGFYQLSRYNVTSLWYKPVYKTDIVEATTESAARRKVEDQYKRYEKSRSESDELFEGIYKVKQV